MAQAHEIPSVREIPTSHDGERAHQELLRIAHLRAELSTTSGRVRRESTIALQTWCSYAQRTTAHFHDGRLIVHGDLTTGLRFNHADGSSCGEPTSPQGADTWARVFQALRRLGFRASEAREAIDRVRATARIDLSLEECLRRALQLLGAGG